MKNIFRLQRSSSESQPQSISTSTSNPHPPSISETLGSPISNEVTPLNPSNSSISTSRPIPIQQRRVSFQDASASRPGPGLPAYSPRDTLGHLGRLGDGEVEEGPESPIEEGRREDREPSLGTSQSRSLVEDLIRASPYAPFGETPLALNEHEEEGGGGDDDDEYDDDPLVPRQAGRMAVSRRRTSDGILLRPTISSPPYLEPLEMPLEFPAPLQSELPVYSANLAADETRLISTVHLDESHPGASFFTALNRGIITSSQPPVEPSTHAPIQTGSKKLSLTLTMSTERLNSNGTGPIFVRLPRLGKVEGTVTVGNVDYGTRLEVSIMGYADTSYYVRGQYTLVDTIPLVKETKVLFPEDAAPEGGIFSGYEPIPSPTPTPAEATSPLRTILGSITTSRSNSNSNGTQAKPSPSEAGSFLKPNSVFAFSMTMPSKHYREDVELPPSAQVFQLGMQASVQYVLRVRLARKGWRLKESLAVPIIYEPRAYLTPRRLRMLTHDDPLNPGWRTIKLNGGKPLKPADPSATGVEAAFLMPSPPVLFVPHGQRPPPIPFHLHFHSSLTLPLATFSDPLESYFIVRLMRVASMRITTEREMRRTPIPCTVEIWQEGGPRITLGLERPVGGENGATGEGRQYPSHVEPAAPTEARRPSEPIRRPTEPSRRRSSFLRRRDSTTGAQPSTSPDTTTALLERTMSSSNPLSPPRIDENHASPLPLDATDVHLMGIVYVNSHLDTHRRLVQSFVGPDISVQYVLEIAVQPRKGAVREAFGHVWGGGLVEVVMGARPQSATPSSR
ncbi:hypothetical protein BCR39DRAFT_530320 [Naematelia encephala]|uniref:Uncharacterized protein n=1 Tax=Naematelia encephala TaxID=71784 RepID=A0A1Y2B601_9TREE|nr:hypothetical protein BCR39DRAFT_530320 [Naematelia encephala]